MHRTLIIRLIMPMTGILKIAIMIFMAVMAVMATMVMMAMMTMGLARPSPLSNSELDVIPSM